jgi:hypothetical protein
MERIEIKNIPQNLISKSIRRITELRSDHVAWHLDSIKEGIQALTKLNYKIVAIDISFIWPDNVHFYQPMWGDCAFLEGGNETYTNLFEDIDTNGKVTIDIIMKLIKRLGLCGDFKDNNYVSWLTKEVIDDLSSNGFDMQKMFFCLYIEE